MNISIIAGKTVQIVSRVWPSRKNRLVLVEKIKEASP